LNGIDRDRGLEAGWAVSDATEQKERERAQLNRHAGLGNLEMLAARYRDHAYALHTHPTYVVGVVVAGIEKLRIGRRHHLAPSGSIIVVNPEVPHDGEKGCPAGWAYRTCYPSTDLMREIADDLELPALPMFAEGVVQAPELARQFVQAHMLAAADRGTGSQAAMLAVLRGLALRFGGATIRGRLQDGSEAARRFRLYRNQIESDVAANLDLSRLAAVAGVTRFQVIRDFKHTAAMTPGQYLRDRRIHAALELLKTDMPLAGIAAELGFADQSHLTRLFKTMKGVSPGAYRAVGPES
jgi:AraC-like DNA-binding protein